MSSHSAQTPAAARAAPAFTVRDVEAEAPIGWLRAGWADFRAMPAASLAYGAVFSGAAWVILVVLGAIGATSLILPMVGGFLLVAPVGTVGLYEMARRRGLGIEPNGPLEALDHARRFNGSQVALIGVLLLLIMIVWVRLAVLIFMLFFGLEPVPVGEFLGHVFGSGQGAMFLLVGTAVGAVMAAATFACTVVSLPMVLDHQVGAITAVITSLEASRRNAAPLVVWGAIIVVVTGIGVATLFLGLAVAMPVLAYGSFHAYRALVASPPAATG